MIFKDINYVVNFIKEQIMPTTKADQLTDDLKNEVASLRKEFSEMMAAIKDKSGAYTEDLAGDMTEKLAVYQQKAKEGAEAAYEKGSEGVDVINSQVRQNPVVSLVVAFGAGYLISKLFSNDK